MLLGAGLTLFSELPRAYLLGNAVAVNGLLRNTHNESVWLASFLGTAGTYRTRLRSWIY